MAFSDNVYARGWRAPNFCRAAVAIASSGQRSVSVCSVSCSWPRQLPRWPGAPAPNPRRRRRFRADDAKCKSYGAEHGTDDYAQCRLAIDIQKANAERAAASLPGGR